MILAVVIAAMLTGCLAVELKVNNDGSCDVTYTIDISQLQGLMSKSDVEKSIKESVEDMNRTAGKTIAKLKNVKENKKENHNRFHIHSESKRDGRWFLLWNS